MGENVLNRHKMFDDSALRARSNNDDVTFFRPLANSIAIDTMIRQYIENTCKSLIEHSNKKITSRATFECVQRCSFVYQIGMNNCIRHISADVR